MTWEEKYKLLCSVIKNHLLSKYVSAKANNEDMFTEVDDYTKAFLHISVAADIIADGEVDEYPEDIRVKRVLLKLVSRMTKMEMDSEPERG